MTPPTQPNEFQETYAYLQPDRLETQGYSYARIRPSMEPNRVIAERINNGRWKALEELTRVLDQTKVDGRTVGPREAESGIGTYVGGYVCFERRSQDSAAYWDYGVVTAYEWNESRGEGSLHLTCVDGTARVLFNEDRMHALEEATYALRPCQGEITVAVMPQEMRARHDDAWAAFMGRNGTAGNRKTATLLRRWGRPVLDESQVIPLMDLSSGKVLQVPTKYVLDFVYYKSRDKRAPKNVVLGETIFGGAATLSPTPGATSGMVADQRDAGELGDSDGEYEPDEPTLAQPTGSARPVRPDVILAGKRERSDDEVARLVALKRMVQDSPNTMRDIDQLIALRRASMPEVSRLPGRTDTNGKEEKAQFRPSALQTSVHQALVNGKYASLSPQLLVETLQSQIEMFSFLPHPAVLRGLYAWDFGLRGLSIMHFVRLTTAERRQYARQQDMSDFSRKNRMPLPATPSGLEDLIEAVDGLSGVCSWLYQPFVSDLLRVVRGFLLQLRSKSDVQHITALDQLTYWLDERLEKFRACLAQGQPDEARNVQLEFNVAHPSYVEIMQAVTMQRLDALSQEPKRETSHRPQQRGASRVPPGRKPTLRVSVPQDVVAALPSHRGKALCMKYLSNHSCKGRGSACIYDYRGHFRPQQLAPAVKAFIETHYGGLKDEFQNL